ncbi:MAG: TonB-dependent receptor [Bacteroidetes bacterium 4572_77]|nr:MAG: TonB-dependent receptor [Bacteroidetes bacterium 4572_77]
MFKHIFFLFVYFIGFSTLFAQELKIIDKQTHTPLGLVSIISENQQLSVITNNVGVADITSIKTSSVFVISLIGYEETVYTYVELEALNFVVNLSPKNYLLNQVVVSAQRWSTEKAQLPSKITAISSKQVEIENPQTAADLLNISGEVFMQKSQMGGGSPMIRGFSANRLLLSVDGVRMNTAIFRGGNLQNVISLDAFTISNTEVLFGPGSVIYGSDALGGVMSFFTLQPKLSETKKMKVTGELDLRYSSANREKTGHFHVNLAWEKWALLSSFSHFNYDDLRMGKYGPEDYLNDFYVIRKNNSDSMVMSTDRRLQKPTSYSQNNFMQKVRYKPNNYWDFEYAFHYSKSSDIPRYDRLIRTKNDLPKYAVWQYGPQIWMMNLWSIKSKKKTKVYDEFSLKAAFQHFEESRINRDFNDSIKINRLEKVNAYSINADFKKNLSHNDQFFYGFEWIWNEVNSQGEQLNILSNELQKSASRYPNSDWSSYALYINYNKHFNEKLLLTAGARYNRYIINSIFDTTFYPLPYTNAKVNQGAFVGNIGINYQPGNNWVLSANFSTGFRAPNVDDMGKVFDSEPGAVVVPNPDLRAEYIYNSEIGISKNFGAYVSVDARAFYSILKDAMVRRDFTLNGQDSMMYDGEMSKIQAIQNATQARIWGFSVGLEAQLLERLLLSSRFNYQKGEDEMPDGSLSPTRHAAPMFGLTQLSYTQQKWTLIFSAHYSGEISYNNLALSEQEKTYLYASDENGHPYSPAWYTLNIKMLYKLNKMLHLSTGIENITNQRYRTYSSGITAAERNFILSLKMRF